MRITGGLLKNRSIKAPKGDSTRPTSEKLRQTTFNICQHYLDNCRFLDLFAGSGAMGIEALSRGARSATFIENNRIALKTIKDNLANLQLLPRSHVLTGDVLRTLTQLKAMTFDLIYIDPPYHQQLHEKTLSIIDQLELLAPGGKLLVEECSLDMPHLNHLKYIKKRKVGDTFLFEFSGHP